MSGTDENLDELHYSIIDVLKEGRATPSYLADRTGESRQLVSHRLRDLQMAGAIEKIHKGLYELSEDPREHREPQVDPIEDALAGWSHGDGEIRQASDHVARASLEWLRDQDAGKVRKSDVPLDELAADDPAGRQENTLWPKVVRSSWKHAVGRGYVEKVDARGYRWVGRDE